MFIPSLIILVGGALNQCYAWSDFDLGVVNGRSVNISEAPYQLQIEYQGRFICGASLLKPNYAISAAHCYINLIENHLTVRAGTSYHDNKGVPVKVSKIIRHESYNNLKSKDYDIAILRLVEPFELGPNIQTIDIRTDEPAEGAVATATGWGQLKEGDRLPSYELQEVSIPVWNREICSAAYAPRNITITERMICAGIRGKDTCQGDSGGPLVLSGRLIGITSFAIGCAREEYPGVYVKVAALADWIRNNTENSDTVPVDKEKEDVVFEKDDVKKLYEAIQKNQKDISAIMTQLTNVNEKIRNLEIENFDLRVKSNINSVEIHGIPETGTEKLYDIVIKVARALGVRNITSDDIRIAHRVPTRTDNSKTVIIAEFVFRKKWELFLEGARKGDKTVFLKDILPRAATQGRVLVFEAMSSKHKELFEACLEKAKLSGFNYVGYTMGKIYLGINKGDRNAIIISYPHELTEIDDAVVGSRHLDKLWKGVPNLPTMHWFRVHD